MFPLKFCGLPANREGRELAEYGYRNYILQLTCMTLNHFSSDSAQGISFLLDPLGVLQTGAV